MTDRGFTRATPRDPCPVCGHNDWCRWFPDGFCECMRLEGDRSTRNGGWLHWVGDGDAPGGDWRDRLTRIPQAPPRPTVDPVARDRYFRALLARCPLSATHRAYLRDVRQFTDEQIARHGYGTLPTDSRAIAAGLVDDLGATVQGPGFYRHNGTPSMYGYPGILLPMVSVDGRIVGMQILPDDQGARSQGKYRHLSSGDKDDGTPSGAPLHVARPASGGDDEEPIITEGIFKADTIADRTGRVVIAMPGVTIQSQIVTILHALNATGAAVALDNDTITNPVVARAETALIERVAAAGLQPSRVMWPSAFKGLDDALLAGVMPMVKVWSVAAGADSDVIADLRERLATKDRQYTDLQALHAAAMQAHRAPHLGPERTIGTSIILDLAATAPRGEWRKMPHKRVAEGAGVSERAVPRGLEKLVPVLDGTVEFETRWIPEAVDQQTGKVSGGHRQTFARLTTEPLKALRTIATAMPATGHKNNHGGHRPICPDCGDVGVVRTWSDNCAGCGQVLEQGKTRIPPRKGQDVVTPDDVECVVVEEITAASVESEIEPPSPNGGTEKGSSSVNVFSSHNLATSHNDETAVIDETTRELLMTASTSPSRVTAQQAREDLEIRLAKSARDRGREPVPKPTTTAMNGMDVPAFDRYTDVQGGW